MVLHKMWSYTMFALTYGEVQIQLSNENSPPFIHKDDLYYVLHNSASFTFLKVILLEMIKLVNFCFLSRNYDLTKIVLLLLLQLYFSAFFVLVRNNLSPLLWLSEAKNMVCWWSIYFSVNLLITKKCSSKNTKWYIEDAQHFQFFKDTIWKLWKTYFS